MKRIHLSKESYRLVGCALAFSLLGFISGRGVPGAATVEMPAPDTMRPSIKHAFGKSTENKDSRSNATVGFEESWKKISSQPPGDRREKTLAELLRERAVHDPTGALALAGQETNLRIRKGLVSAALCGWATVDPGGASSWAAEHLTEDERKRALQEIIESGMVCRDLTVRAIGELCEKDPTLGFDTGHALIESLGRNGDYEMAVKFAGTGTGDNKNYWLSTAFLAWAQYLPEDAVAGLAKISDPAASNEALHGLIYGWASNEPAALVKFASTLPPGDVRKTAMNEGLQHWINADPAAASAWMDNNDPTADLDSGVAAAATNPHLIAEDPNAAIQRATRISDPKQRAQALADIISQWSKHDPEAAKRYAASSQDLHPDRIVRLMSEIEAANPR